jgi:hypothetical protein
MFIHTLMGAEAGALCGAAYGERSTERTNRRIEYRHRQFDRRAGTLDLPIPKPRQGSHVLDWILERRKPSAPRDNTVVPQPGSSPYRSRHRETRYDDYRHAVSVEMNSIKTVER